VATGGRRLLSRQARAGLNGFNFSVPVPLFTIVPLADGGSHDAENLTLLCSAHHRELHKGTLAITGRAPAITIRFVAAHVGRMNEPLPAITDALRNNATLALTTLGFSKPEATQMVERAVGASPPDTTLEQLIRAALPRPS